MYDSSDPPAAPSNQIQPANVNNQPYFIFNKSKRIIRWNDNGWLCVHRKQRSTKSNNGHEFKHKHTLVDCKGFATILWAVMSSPLGLDGRSILSKLLFVPVIFCSFFRAAQNKALLFDILLIYCFLEINNCNVVN